MKVCQLVTTRGIIGVSEIPGSLPEQTLTIKSFMAQGGLVFAFPEGSYAASLYPGVTIY